MLPASLVAVVHVDLAMCDLLRTLLSYNRIETICLPDDALDVAAIGARLAGRRPRLVVWNLLAPYADDLARARAVQQAIPSPLIFVTEDVDAAGAALDEETAASLLTLSRDVSELARLSTVIGAALPDLPD